MTWLLGALSALFRAVRTNPALCVVIALAGLSAWFWHGKTVALAERDRTRHQVTLEIAAHRQTKANYRAAQLQAQQMEAARLARVQTEQQRIAANVSSDYASRLADLRSRYERMHRGEEARALAYGTSGGQSVPAIPDAASRAYDAPGPEGLSLDERFLASQQAEQLDALITWVRTVSAIDVDGR